MKRYLTILTLALAALAASAQTVSPAASGSPAPAHKVAVVPPEMITEYYKQWGEYQSMIARFQQSMSSQQRALQEEIKAREEKVNAQAQKMVGACGGTLDVKSLNEQNVVKCLPAPVEAAAKK